MFFTLFKGPLARAALAALAAAPLVAARPAAAQSYLQVQAALLMFDANGDGLVSRGEVLATRLRQFSSWDGNKNGVLDAGDIAVARRGPMDPSRAKAFFALQDANNDGVVTRQELAKGPTPGFDAADQDRDGVLRRDEIARLIAEMR